MSKGWGVNSFLLGLCLPLLVNSDTCGCSSDGTGSFDENSPEEERRKRSLDETDEENIWPNEAVQIDDMILMPYNLLKWNNYEMKFRNSMKDKEFLWPKGQLVYEFDSRYPSHLRTKVRAKIKEFNEEISRCVKIIEGRRAPNEYYANVTNLVDGCGSLVGCANLPEGYQEINLDETCVNSPGIVKHEFMHALGFEHEQSRPDRDKHLTIHWENINKGVCSNFDICKGCKVDTPYDYASVMHYDSHAFSCNDKMTMARVTSNKKIGKNFRLSPSDKIKIRALYSCHK
jgi:hypothetical protein